MYASLTDMLDRFDRIELVQLTDIGDVLTGEVDAGRVATALTYAGSVIDSYVAVKYRTGAVPIPPLLTEIACDLARHRLFRDAAPETVKEARDIALSQLKDIAKGVIKLDQGEEQLDARPGAILIDRPDRVFGREALKGF